MTTLPLDGVRVLDLSRVLAGPLCTMMLGDLGAHVLKVERPNNGDDTRGWGPPFDANGLSAYFRAANRNKFSVALDFDLPADRSRLLDLIAEADIVVDNFLPGVLARRAIDPDALLHAHPTLIWCTLSGFGPESPRPGYDFLLQAEAGWMAVSGPVHGPPSKVGIALVDVIAGKDAAVAVLAALAARGRPQVSRRLHVSLHASATAALVNVAQNVLVSGQSAGRWGNAHPNLVPYELFDARDRALAIAVGTDAQFRACAHVLALPASDVDGPWRTNAGRVADRERLVGAMQHALAARDAPCLDGGLLGRQRALWARQTSTGSPRGRRRAPAIRPSAGHRRDFSLPCAGTRCPRCPCTGPRMACIFVIVPRDPTCRASRREHARFIPPERERMGTVIPPAPVRRATSDSLNRLRDTSYRCYPRRDSSSCSCGNCSARSLRSCLRRTVPSNRSGLS